MDGSSGEDKSLQIKDQMKEGIYNFFSRTLVRLQSRVQSIEVKMGSLSKIVRLLQQYSERKDQQYEKQSTNMHAFHKKIAKIQELQQLSLKYSQIALNVQNHTLRLQQITHLIQAKQAAIKQAQQRFNYEVHEVWQKMERLQTGMLQQIKEGSKKGISQQEKHPNNYILEELTFKLTQLQHTHKADYQRIARKLQKVHPKESKQDNAYGLQHVDKQKSVRKKSNSQLKLHRSK